MLPLQLKMLIMSFIKLAIFASGSGTNAENIIKHFSNHPTCKVSLILSNKKNAYVLERAKRFKIPFVIFDRDQLENSTFVDDIMSSYNINYIILAGFLLKIPDRLLNKYPKKIINIHPALLPKYGGKGMHGMNVHSAVINDGETESGITIHLVNNEYDKGTIIFQAKCNVEKEDTPETLATKIHQLEQQYFPEVIEQYILQDTNYAKK